MKISTQKPRLSSTLSDKSRPRRGKALSRWTVIHEAIQAHDKQVEALVSILFDSFDDSEKEYIEFTTDIGVTIPCFGMFDSSDGIPSKPRF